MPLCPECHTDNDAATSFEMDDAIPSDGDVTVCLYCGALAIFTDETTLFRRPTAEERKELLANSDVVSAIRAVHDIQKRIKAPYN
jgi:hypothetical protein